MSYNFANNQSLINKPSTFGLSPNGASLISYLWIPVTSVIVLVTEKENRLVRFHAFQSLFLGLSFIALTIILSVIIGIITLIAGAVSPFAGLFVTVISLIVWIFIAFVMLFIWVLCLVKAYRGEMYKLPVIGVQSEKMVNK